MSIMHIYHGSSVVVEKPVFGQGKDYNDYGRGFYCTENIELAKEWACRTENDGYVNSYVLKTDDLTIVRLQEPDYNILNWMAVLLKNRKFNINTPVMAAGKAWLLDHYLLDLGQVDMIIGYRADDSYFSFARAFLSNGITMQQLEQAMHLGKLGEQVVLMSEDAFRALQFTGVQRVDGSIYHSLREDRDRRARQQFREELMAGAFDGIYLSDLIRGGVIDGHFS